MCCVQVARGLMDKGYSAGTEKTLQIMERWAKEPSDAWLRSNSVRFLRSTGQERDLEFVMTHQNDLNEAYRVEGSEVRPVGGMEEPASKSEEETGGVP